MEQMPTEAKPLFRLDALRTKLAAFVLPSTSASVQPRLGNWTDLLSSKAAEKMKETELLADFIRDVFGDLLGYVGPASGSGVYTLKRESLVQVDGKFADAALGRFTLADGQADFVAVIEGKGPRDPLDRPFGSRKRSAVEQALQYAVNLQIDWFLVTNMRETRLFHKGHDLFTYERFETARLAGDDAALKRFAFLLGAERVVPAAGPTHLDALLADSRRIGRELTNDYYHEYATLRRQTFHELRRANPDVPPADLLAVTQKILDRVLFIAFSEDRGLLPAKSIASAFRHADPYNPRPIWDNFRGLFRAIDEGNKALEISKYNGGLFATDELLEKLRVPDVVCKGFDKLAAYEYGKDADNPNAKMIDVEILGHIFEQSISDLEALHQQIIAPFPTPVGPASRAGPVGSRDLPDSTPTKAGPSKRKKEGAFYTPAFVTRYIVAETLQPILADRFETLRQQYEDEAKGATKKLFADPRAYDLRELTGPQRKALADFWNAWIDTLATIRIVDPACGSGAFLLEAFDQLHLHYQQANARLTELINQPLFADVDKQILQSNLFGMDLNFEAIEICRLSLWIKTATQGKVLTSLDDNVKQGNSVIGEPSPHEAWKKRFPAALADGGFDVVIGNPPYVRQEWIAKDKPFLEKHYRAYDGVADLYVYFYELGMKLLKPGGRLGFVVTNKWMRAGYGEPLRNFFGKSAWVEQVVDFGHAKQIFPDADVFPSILVARKPTNVPSPASARVCAIPREQLRMDDLSRQIKSEGYDVPRDRWGAEPWSLEPPGVATLMEKIGRTGLPMSEYAGSRPAFGIKTGFNRAFLIDAQQRDSILKIDHACSSIMKPYLRGQDIDRWLPDWKGLWIILMKSSGNHSWPWTGKSPEDAENTFASTYPAIHSFMKPFEGNLRARSDKGCYWWELRSCSYYGLFDRPKIMWQDLGYHSAFCRCPESIVAEATCFALDSSDLWLLAVLNSPTLWSWLWRNTIHGKDEVLRLKTLYTEKIPVPVPNDAIRAESDIAVKRLIDITAEQQAGRRALLDWLRLEFGIDKPSQKLQDVARLDADELAAEVKKARGRSKPLSVAEVKRLKEEHGGTVAPLQALAGEARTLEERVSDLVIAAYGLTAEEVALMWRTAPPRMPLQTRSTC
jgi:type I restriction-modification system DNA methylase subunit